MYLIITVLGRSSSRKKKHRSVLRISLSDAGTRNIPRIGPSPLSLSLLSVRLSLSLGPRGASLGFLFSGGGGAPIQLSPNHNNLQRGCAADAAMNDAHTKREPRA